jgi:hypothetical protein
MTQRPLAMPATPSPIVRLAPKALQIAQRAVANDRNLTPTPPIAAIGPTARNVRFAAEASGAIAAGPGPNFDSCAIIEHPSIVTATRDPRRLSRQATSASRLGLPIDLLSIIFPPQHNVHVDGDTIVRSPFDYSGRKKTAGT